MAKLERGAATRRAYDHDWLLFSSWCIGNAIKPLGAPAEVVALYLRGMAGQRKKIATIERALASIVAAHKDAGLVSPRGSVIRDTLADIRRVHGVAQKQMAPIAVEELRRMVGTLGKTPIGIRDRALLLVGFLGAFRSSELVSLDVCDLYFGQTGMTLRKKRNGAERNCLLKASEKKKTCPVRAMREWLEVSGDAEGPVFVGLTKAGRSTGMRLCGHDVARIVKRTALAAGLDPKRYAGHSLIVGAATAADSAGRPLSAIMERTGHKSAACAVRCIRKPRGPQEDVTSGLGL